MSMQHDQRGEDGLGLKGCGMTILYVLALVGAFAIFVFVVCSIGMSRSLEHMH